MKCKLQANCHHLTCNSSSEVSLVKAHNEEILPSKQINLSLSKSL